MEEIQIINKYYNLAKTMYKKQQQKQRDFYENSLRSTSARDPALASPERADPS